MFHVASRIIIVLALAVAGIFAAVAVAGSSKSGHVSICHHTGQSRAHEWVYISPAASGVVNGHGKVNHNYAEDIIPAFSYQSNKGTVSFAGENLNTRYDASLEPTANGSYTGSQILAAHCQVPSGGTTTGVTTAPNTTTNSTTTVTVTTTTTTTKVPVKVHKRAKPAKPTVGKAPFTG